MRDTFGRSDLSRGQIRLLSDFNYNSFLLKEKFSPTDVKESSVVQGTKKSSFPNKNQIPKSPRTFLLAEDQEIGRIPDKVRIVPIQTAAEP